VNCDKREDFTHPHNKTQFATVTYIAEPVLGVDACRRLDIVHIDVESVCDCEVSETKGPESPTHASVTTESRATAGTALV